MTATPDAAMLWARGRAAQRHRSRTMALEILAGKEDEYSAVADLMQQAHRAGQSHERAELLAKLRLRAVGSDGTFAVALGEVIRMIETGEL